jgi:hypothetical protein
MAVVLKPDKRVANRFHALMSVATALGIATLVILFGGVSVTGFVAPLIYVGAYVISVQVAVTGDPRRME